jgi:hypothetical protein
MLCSTMVRRKINILFYSILYSIPVLSLDVFVLQQSVLPRIQICLACCVWILDVSVLQQPVLPLNMSVLHQPVLQPKLPLDIVCMTYSSLSCLWMCLHELQQPELPLDVSA